MAGCAKTIQINLGVIEVAELPGSCARIHDATKTRILCFSQSTVGCSPEEENRQSEKLHFTLNVRDGWSAGLTF
jgi:hypothetical protein